MDIPFDDEDHDNEDAIMAASVGYGLGAKVGRAAIGFGSFVVAGFITGALLFFLS